MASSDLGLIIEKLQERFREERIVFWYDDDGGFADCIDEIGKALISSDVKVHILNMNEQFRTKYLLERQEPDQRFLVYAQFPKPPLEDNCLEDTLLYSGRFRASPHDMLISELRIGQNFKQTILDHYSFFKSGDRKKKFVELNLDINPGEWSERVIFIGMMRVLTRTQSKYFEDILLNVLDAGIEENRCMDDFRRYGLEEGFWSLCGDEYGYDTEFPSLGGLILSLFSTYASVGIAGDPPDSWRNHITHRQNDISVLLGKMKSSIKYGKLFAEISQSVSGILRVDRTLRDRDIADYIGCDAFDDIETLISDWILENLIAENISARVGEADIGTICDNRKKTFFGERRSGQYDMFTAACKIISSAEYKPASSFSQASEQYVLRDCLIDRAYRNFYDAWKSIPDPDDFEDLRKLIENIYANEYLYRQLPAWNDSLDIGEAMRGDKAQGHFFNTHIKGKEKTAVIVSDALRYEVGMELFEELSKDSRYDVRLDHMFGGLPAYTQLGMASLLPHGKLEIQKDSSVLSDGLPTNSTEKREMVLKKTTPNSCCVQSSDIGSAQASREMFNGMETVYVYHNQIDVRGKDAMGDEVFVACKEAIRELISLVKKLRNANVYRVIITADHGFLFRWDGIPESDKIDINGLEGDVITDRRFIISENRMESEGLMNLRLGEILGNDDRRNLSWPKGPNVFKTKGGLKFVHGGSSPQETIIPLITVKISRDRTETHPAEITLITPSRKITNLIHKLEFLQKEPVGEETMPATYSAYFLADNNERISDTARISADKKDKEPQKRSMRVNFNFKDRKFAKDRKYWLIVADEKGHEVSREEFVMDIAFSSGIGFD
ncbi:MAG: BREX-1 system phosphatase PglZ type A [Candidatus Methanoplasma sp.]|jgi:uncharacterized protein (TIGR02687 family)|nr:BREX-1 system phosphatase PglZ type A [Candidatus Methanoplasma sp.]